MDRREFYLNTKGRAFSGKQGCLEGRIKGLNLELNTSQQEELEAMEKALKEMMK